MSSKIRDFIDACDAVKRARRKYIMEFRNFGCIDRFPWKPDVVVSRMPYYSVDVPDGEGEYDEKLGSKLQRCGLYKQTSYCLNKTCFYYDKNLRYVDLTNNLVNAKRVRNRAFWAMFGIKVK